MILLIMLVLVHLLSDSRKSKILELDRLRFEFCHYSYIDVLCTSIYFTTVYFNKSSHSNFFHEVFNFLGQQYF